MRIVRRQAQPYENREARIGHACEATIYSRNLVVMPQDPNKPKHPQGLPVADDAPVYIAPSLDLRQTQRDIPAIDESDDVPFTLPFPAEERASSLPPPLDDAPISEAPTTVSWDRVSARLPSEPAGQPRRDNVVTIDTSADDDEREAILRDLHAIAGLDSRPDRVTDRAVAQRATLARARALRFRLTLLDAWSGVDSPGSSSDERALHFDMATDAMLLVAIADGAPGESLPVVHVMVEGLRGIRSDLPRTALRDRGAAAIARLTIVGYRSALDQLARSAVAATPESRRLTLDLAARAAVGARADASLNEHRLGALQDLERALALPTGSVAPAIETARRRRAKAAFPR
jgi:hypothetical protein